MRLMAYNVYLWRGWPEEVGFRRLRQVAVAERFAKALGEYEPDVLTFSEVSSDSIVSTIAERLRMQAVTFPSSEQFPGALLSRFDILKTAHGPLRRGPRPQDLFTRHWGRAILDTGEEEVIVHSAHLFPDPGSALHHQEVEEVIRAIREDMKSGRSVLLQGDLNHEPKDPAYKSWIEAGLVDTFTAAGTGPGETYRPAGRSPREDQPNQRIDYIFACGPIVQRLRECRVLSDPPFRVDPGASEPWSLSDHLPVMATFS